MPYFERLGFLVPTFENPSDFYMRIMQTEGAALTAAWAKAAPPMAYPALASAAGLSGDASRGGSGSGGGAASPLGRLSAKLKATTGFGATAADEAGVVVVVAGAAVVPWDPQGKWLQCPEAKSRRAQATASGWQQYRVLLHRFLADSYKDRGKMLSGILMEGTIGLLIGLVWFQQDVHDSSSAFAVAGVFIMLTTIAIFDNCVSVGLKFPLTRALHFREFRWVTTLIARRQTAKEALLVSWGSDSLSLSRTVKPAHSKARPVHTYNRITTHHNTNLPTQPTRHPKNPKTPQQRVLPPGAVLPGLGHLFPPPLGRLPARAGAPRLLPRRPRLHPDQVPGVPPGAGAGRRHGRLPGLHRRDAHERPEAHTGAADAHPHAHDRLLGLHVSPTLGLVVGFGGWERLNDGSGRPHP